MNDSNDATVSGFLSHLHRGGKYGHWWTKNDNGMRSFWWPVGNPSPIPSGHTNVYFGVHPTNEIPTTNSSGKPKPPGAVRSQNAYIAAINCLFAEFDAKDYGGKDKALDHLFTLVPTPSVVIDSGGGYHCYWLLRETFVIFDETTRKRADRLQKAWVERMGGDGGAKDLARVLRVPGTYNYKDDYAPDFPRVKFERCEMRCVYSLDELEALVPKEEPRAAPRTYNSTDDTQRAAKALERLNPARRDSYQPWTDVGMALSELGSDGLALWDNWSQGSSKYKAGECDAKWKSFKPGSGKTLASLFHWANEDSPIPARRREYYEQEPPPDMGYEDCDVGIDCSFTEEFVEEESAADSPNLDSDEKTAETERATPARVSRNAFMPLPDSARLDPELGKDACPWLDEYIAFSKFWSPQSFGGYHEACGLWILSTIAARRVYVHLGGPRYTNLYIALLGRTGTWTKSTTAKIAIQCLQDTGLSWMLAPDDSTPQKFVADLALKVPDGYGEMSDERREILRRRLTLAAQKGWFYEEFGQKISAMLAPNGFMSEFRGILRRWDDCPETYQYATIGRGLDDIERPYLALMGLMTPADLRSAGRRGDSMWSDGFWARFVLVAPPMGANVNNDRFPVGERTIPSRISQPLIAWDQRLGTDCIEITQTTDENGKGTGRYSVNRSPAIRSSLSFGPGVVDAFYNYHDAMRWFINDSSNSDLDGNYIRFAEKALRVAMLFGSMDNGRIEMKHWAKAQEIVERWRVGLHDAYEQINAPSADETGHDLDEALRHLHRLNGGTVNDVRRFMPSKSVTEMEWLLDKLVEAGEAIVVGTTRRGTKRYGFPKQEK